VISTLTLQAFRVLIICKETKIQITKTNNQIRGIKSKFLNILQLFNRIAFES